MLDISDAAYKSSHCVSELEMLEFHAVDLFSASQPADNREFCVSETLNNKPLSPSQPQLVLFQCQKTCNMQGFAAERANNKRMFGVLKSGTSETDNSIARPAHDDVHA